MPDFPTALAARRCIKKDIEGCTSSIGWTITRALSLTAGMYLAGERDNLWRKALIGSLAVETFVAVWSATHLHDKEATLPSATAVLSGQPALIALTYAARSLMVFAALNMAGYKSHAMRNSLAGVAMIELSVLLWGQSHKRK